MKLKTMTQPDWKKIIGKFSQNYSENKVFKLLIRRSEAMGTKLIYTVLLMFYSYRREETPFWAKNIIIGSLGYLVSPIDAIPDLSPIIGYTDDIGVLSFGLVTIASYVNSEIKDKAKSQMSDWFSKWNQEDVLIIDQKL